MRGSVRNPESSWRASSWFWKARAAVELAARISARVVSSRASRLFKLATSWTTSAPPVRTRAVVVVSMIARISLRRMVVRGALMASSFGGDDLGLTKELRADRQPGAVRRGEIDPQPQAIPLYLETDDPVAPGEVFRVPDREHAPSTQHGPDMVEAPRLRGTDEENLAAVHLLHRPKPADDQLAGSHGLARDDLVEPVTKRVLAENSDGDRRVLSGEGLGGPAHEMRELEQENRLEVVLARPARLRGVRGVRPGGHDRAQ